MFIAACDSKARSFGKVRCFSSRNELSWRYQTLLHSLERKGAEVEQLSKDFESKIRAKEVCVCVCVLSSLISLFSASVPSSLALSLPPPPLPTCLPACLPPSLPPSLPFPSNVIGKSLHVRVCIKRPRATVFHFRACEHKTGKAWELSFSSSFLSHRRSNIG